MERILVCSDIHGQKMNFIQALEEAGSIDRILIAGDIEADPREYEKIAGLTPLVMVRGNCDSYLGAGLPLNADFIVEGRHFFITHGHEYRVRMDKPTLLLNVARRHGADTVIFGHTHSALEEEWDGIRVFNPGALRGIPGYGGCSYLILEIDGQEGSIKAFFHTLLSETEKNDRYAQKSLSTMMMSHNSSPIMVDRESISTAEIQQCLKEIAKGRPVSWIAGKYSIAEPLAEEICRIALTHPGVTAEAVMMKMGL